MTHPPLFAHPRYRLADTIGVGGMGTIARAFDRLTHTWVALKQLLLESEEAAPPPSATAEANLRLDLATEFQLLATLRHPHIVSVLDYGFVGANAFFTMEYLEDGVPLTTAAGRQPLAQQLRWLGQLLQALEYVRRHQVVHRDLKPDNVLVQQGQVKVLDFGLAALEGHRGSSMGSLFYMAPEMFDEITPVTHATDLFAVGVMAYEMLTGQPPFVAESVDQVIEAICTAEPDYDPVPGPVALRGVLARLLAKDPTARYATAAEALAALATAGEVDLPLETQATQASLLQAAPLVGREKELTQLQTALTQARRGQGSAWLIGGEIGVGKSRLLDEMRTQALVQGAWAWHGQSMSEGGAPAELWRDVLAWLALAAPLNDLTASVFKPFVPHLEELLGRAVNEAPSLEGKAAQDRFCGFVLDSLREVALRQPLVLILEDLQWSGPLSRAVLAWVMRGLQTLPILLIGTYRSDEQPQLPRELPPAHHLVLPRLGAAQVAHLTSAIGGLPVGQLSALSQFMYQETEGNALFVVEILRSLAAEAGLLSQVHGLTLPEHLLAGGMQAVIQRRLQRIDPRDYPWMEVAALAGRELDLALLRHLDREFDWPGWLSRCAEAVVLEPQGAGWRFAHDQLRQVTLRGIAPARAQALHEQIAAGLEQVYANDLTPHFGRLAHHYKQTTRVDKQRWYLAEAARVEEAAYDLAAAKDYYTQLLPLLPPEAQGEIYLKRGAVLDVLSEWAAAESDYRAALAAGAGAAAQFALGQLCRQRGDYANALEWLTQAQTQWAAQNDSVGLRQVLIETGSVLMFKGDYADAHQPLEEGLALARAQQDPAGVALALNRLGGVAWGQGDYPVAWTLNQESLTLRRALGDRQGIAWVLNNLGIIAYSQHKYDTAQTLYEESLTLYRELGSKWGIGVSLLDLGLAANAQGEYAAARGLLEDSLAIQRELGDKWGIVLSLGTLGHVALAQSEYPSARRCYAESLTVAKEISEKLYLVYDLGGLAAVRLATGQALDAARLAAASETLCRAVKIAREPVVRKIYEATVAGAQAQLDEATFAAAWAAGEKMTLDEAVQLALQEE